MAFVPEDRLFTRLTVLISVVGLIAFTFNFFLITSLPLYIIDVMHGQQSDLGLVNGVLSLAAVITYPIVGPLMDRRGRKIVITFGLVLYAITTLLYVLAPTTTILFIVRAFQGVAWAATVSTYNTIAGDVAPLNRRGEAMAYFGLFTNLAMAIGPALSLFFIDAVGYERFFLICAALVIGDLLLSLTLPETLGWHGRPLPSAASASVSIDDTEQHHGKSEAGIALRASLLPAALVSCSSVSFGSMISFFPVYAREQGVENPGLFFATYAFSVILVRAFSGRVSDRFGYGAIIAPGFVFVCASMFVLSLTATLPIMIGVALVFGMSFGGIYPALQAHTVDTVAPEVRGTALGYVTAAFDIGIGVGSVTLGIVAQFLGFSSVFAGASLAALLGFTIITWKRREFGAKREVPSKAAA